MHISPLKNTHQHKKNFYWFGFGILIFIFIFSRFYLLKQNVYFWGDIGRDHEMLIEMVQDRKPMLLGPSNSQLPFNQSAWYFYLNIPIFIFTSFSAYTTAITGVILNVFAIGILFFLFLQRPSAKEWWSFFIFIALIIFHPLFIEQQRTTWNPAFAVPFLIVAMTLVWKLLNEHTLSNKWIMFLAACLSFSIGMTFAVIPIFLMITILLTWKLRGSHRLLWIGSLCMTLFLVFLPHLIFELRHDFLLTYQLSHSLDKAMTESVNVKLYSAVVHMIGFKTGLADIKFVAFVITLFIIGFFRVEKNRRAHLFTLVCTGVLSLGMSLLFVDQFHNHYSLGFIVIFLFVISQLSKNWRTLLLFVLLWGWQPLIYQEFVKSPHRTVHDLERCGQLICATRPDPMYLSTQAWHSFHTGYDYSFFFNKHGCYTRDIATHPEFSQTLAVVVDSAEFDPEKTDFHELSLFNPKELKDVVSCSDSLSVYFFQKR